MIFSNYEKNDISELGFNFRTPLLDIPDYNPFKCSVICILHNLILGKAASILETIILEIKKNENGNYYINLIEERMKKYSSLKNRNKPHKLIKKSKKKKGKNENEISSMELMNIKSWEGGVK